jgi:hypothetical protein
MGGSVWPLFPPTLSTKQIDGSPRVHALLHLRHVTHGSPAHEFQISADQTTMKIKLLAAVVTGSLLVMSSLAHADRLDDIKKARCTSRSHF